MGATPTIHDVARHAGVSISTVSRVLNGGPTRDATVKAVMEAVELTGYKANAVGRSLQSQRTNQVTFSVPDVGIGAYVDMLRAIERVLDSAGMGLTLRWSKGRSAFDAELVDALPTRFTDGIIMSPLRVDDLLLEALKRAASPVVLIGLLPEDFPLDSTRTDSREGARMAVEYLLDRGCRRIGFLGGPLATEPGQSRLDGYRDGLRGAGITFDASLVELSETFDFSGGKVAASALLSRADLDGLLAANDPLAVAAGQVAYQRGITLPSDLQLVGMDDSELAASFPPGLTSVDLRARELGSQAAELVLARLEKPDRQHETRYFPPRLICRGSTL